MGIETPGLIGFFLVAAALVRTAYGRRLDRQSADTALDRFRALEVTRQYQIASTVAG